MAQTQGLLRRQIHGGALRASKFDGWSKARDHHPWRAAGLIGVALSCRAKEPHRLLYLYDDEGTHHVTRLDGMNW